MADISNLSNYLKDVADAIRTKKETTGQIPAAEFDTEILSIETGSQINNQNKEITTNGTYTADEGYTGLGTVTVNVPQEGGSGDIKQFSTVEEMNNSTGNKEGDLAVVYRSEITNAAVDSKFSTAIFPETVVLTTAITDYVDIRYRAVDSSVMFDCMGMLDGSSFRMDCYTDSGEIRIEYRSEDGITYTRTDTTGNPVDFGTEIYYERAEYWNDAIGKFIQCGGNVFDGLFEYKHLKDNTRFQFRALNTLQYNAETSTINMVDNILDTVYDLTAIRNIRSTMWSAGIKTTVAYLDNNNDLYFIGNDKQGNCNVYFIGENGELSHIGDRDSSITKFYIYKINLENTSYELSKTINVQNVTPYGERNAFKCIPFSELNAKSLSVLLNLGDGPAIRMDAYSTSKNITFSNTGRVFYEELIPYNCNSYVVAPNQFTTLKDHVYDSIYYGKDGVNEGTLTLSPSDTFADTNAEVYRNILQHYNNMEPRVLTDDDKTIDNNIYLIPTKSDGTPLLDISSVTNMRMMFYNCLNLTTIPLLDTSNSTNMQHMFSGCKNLTTIPLLNTSNVTNMEDMFYNCPNLTTIPLLDTSKVVYMGSMFGYCTNLTTIPQLDTSNVTNMDSIFSGCSHLTNVPLLNTSKVTQLRYAFASCESLTEIPQLNTSSAASMAQMFRDCTNLTTVPLLNTSKVEYMEEMVYGCTNLSNESLNNILAMCKNATKYTGTKTLKFIGLTSEQANICKTLSNYNAFTSAGWKTGY